MSARKRIRRAFAALLAALAASQLLADGSAQRIVALGGSVTETVVALGAGDRLVARDSTSTFPESVLALPDVGYVRALSPEGVLSVGPDLILAEEGAGPPQAVEVLAAAGVDFVTIPGRPDPAGVAEKIRAVGHALDRDAAAAALAGTVEAELAALAAANADLGDPQAVLFVLSLQDGRLMVGGEGSSADGIIRLAGAQNAATGFQGYKPMTDEAVLAAAPDVILMMDRAGDLAVSDADVLAHPALGATPAARDGRIVRMDGMLLLGFGPRTPEAARTLHAAIYGGAG